MFARLSHTRLLRYAGLFTWAVVGIPLLYSWLVPLFGDGRRGPAGAAADAMAGLASPTSPSASATGWLTRGLGVRRRTLGDFALLLVLTAGRDRRSATSPRAAWAASC